MRIVVSEGAHFFLCSFRDRDSRPVSQSSVDKIKNQSHLTELPNADICLKGRSQMILVCWLLDLLREHRYKSLK